MNVHLAAPQNNIIGTVGPCSADSVCILGMDISPAQ